MEANLIKTFNIEPIFDKYWKEWSDEFFCIFNPECKGKNMSSNDYRQRCYCNIIHGEENHYFKVKNRKINEDVLSNIKKMYESLCWLSHLDNSLENLLPSAYGLILILENAIKSIRYENSIHNKLDITFLNDAHNDFYLDIQIFGRYSNFNLIGENPLFVELSNKIIDYYKDSEDYERKMTFKTDGSLTIGLIWAYAMDLIYELAVIYNKLMSDLIGRQFNTPENYERYENTFLYNMFMHYQCCAKKYRKRANFLPSKCYLEEVKSDFLKLLEQFKTTSLGKHWCVCMPEDDGFEYMIKYYRQQALEWKARHKIIEWRNEENEFFTMLDNLFVMIDILSGDAEKYGLAIKYPKNWNFNTYGGLIKEEFHEVVLNNKLSVWKTCNLSDKEIMEEMARREEAARLYDQYLESQGQELCLSSPVPTGAGVKGLSEAPNAGIPQKCKDAVDRYINNSFTNEKTKEVLNSRGQLMKAAKGMNCEKKSNFGYLMQIAIEVKAIKADTSYMDFARMMVGLGVLNYENEKELAKYSGSIGKAKVDKTKELWKGLYKAITTK